MDDQEKIYTINYCLEVKQTIEDLLRKMNIFYEEIEVFKGLSSSGPKFIIKSSESGLLIGARGEHLRAINHLTKRIVYKKNSLAKFTVDINNYQEENIKKIKNLALSLADKVKNSGEILEMEPMSSYERMIIHSLFSQNPEIETESVGDKDQRRVVIKPKS